VIRRVTSRGEGGRVLVFSCFVSFLPSLLIFSLSPIRLLSLSPIHTYVTLACCFTCLFSFSSLPPKSSLPLLHEFNVSLSSLFFPFIRCTHTPPVFLNERTISLSLSSSPLSTFSLLLHPSSCDCPRRVASSNCSISKYLLDRVDRPQIQIQHSYSSLCQSFGGTFSLFIFD